MRSSATRSCSASPATCSCKPRGQWHTFWNAGDVPARILEIISPAGFERFFEELAALEEAGAAETGAVVALAAGYGCELDPSTVPGLLERHDVTFG